MTNDERELLLNLNLGKISKEEFITQYPINLKREKNYILNLVKEAFNNQNGSDLSLALNLIVFDHSVIYDQDFIELLCLILKEKWHHEHENLALMFQAIKSPKSIDILYDTALAKFDYLDYDDTYSLARKCIHALGDINTEKSKEKLKLLAQSDIPIIKQKAKKQLYYYKR